MQAVTAAISRGGRRDRGDGQPDPPHPLRAGIERSFATVLAECSTPRVVVIAPGKATRFRTWVHELRPDAQLAVVAADFEGSDRHVALAATTPLDLLIDHSGNASTPSRIASLIRYVRRGGVLLGRLSPELRRAGATERAEYENAVLDLGPRIEQLTLLEQQVVAVSGLDRQPIIREAEVASLLEKHPHLGRVLEVRPGQHVRAHGAIRMNRSDQRFPVIDEWTTPPLALREYRDAVSSPGQVARTGDLLLPESFRHIFRPRVKNRWLAPTSMQQFADPANAVTPKYAGPAPEGGPRRLAGSYFHLDNELRGHFGHTTTEMLAKLWGWRVAKQADPELKALLHANLRDTPAEWELTLLEAAGVSRGDIVYTRDPVQVDRLVGATPMFGNPRYAHPDLVGTWEGIADRLEAGTNVDAPDRIFVSRRPGGRRSCVNGDEVEELFVDLGYAVIYPEEYPLGDQVRLFRRARAVAGFAGSGMFGLMWATEPKPVILVSSEGYPGRNEFLIAGLIGHDLDVVWSTAELTDPETGQPRRGIEAPFMVDLERDGSFIRSAAARAA